MLSNEKLLEFYKTMVLIRKFEEKANECYERGLIRGSIHTCIGQEGIAVGAIASINDNDYILTHHRAHGQLIARGCDIKYMMAELFGKKDGYCKGKGGSIHIASIKHNVLGANGIVGGGNPLAIGAAFSAQYKNSNRVALSFFGDGASNQGTFHESINLAAAWKLPVVFIAENNTFAISTPFNTISATKNIADRAAGYGIPGIIADGLDAVDVYEKIKSAVDRARRKEGPTLVECKTYRFVPHSRSDREVYRTKEEVNEWRKKGPIIRMEKLLKEKGIVNQSDIKNIEENVLYNVEKAIEFAKHSPEPGIEELKKDIFFIKENKI